MEQLKRAFASGAAITQDERDRMKEVHEQNNSPIWDLIHRIERLELRARYYGEFTDALPVFVELKDLCREVRSRTLIAHTE